MFYPQIPLMPEGTVADFPNLKSASQSPLARTLFALDGVKGVFLSKEYITVLKREDMTWKELKPAIFETLMDFFASGRPIMDEGASMRKDTEIKEDDDEVVIMIKEILDSHIRPGVAQDGGDVEYRGFSQGVVMLKLQGSCSGCASSSSTLKHGILRTLQHYVPEVEHVIAVEDDDLNKISLEEFNKTEKAAAKTKD